MDEIEKITLDLTDCKYIRDFHERIRIAFDFPEWYGRNLDAFWDLMTEPRFFKATIIGSETMAKDLQEYFVKIIQILEDAKEEQKRYGCFFEYEILS